MKKSYLFAISTLLLIATIITAHHRPNQSARTEINALSTTSQSRSEINTMLTSRAHSREKSQTTTKPDPQSFLKLLTANDADTLDLPLAFQHVDRFRLASEEYLPALTSALKQAHYPMAKGLIAQAMLRIPSEESVQKVFEAACLEPDHAAREAILDSFKSLESDQSRDLLLSAIVATDHPHILTSLLPIITETPTPQTKSLLQVIAPEPNLSPASSAIIQVASSK